MFWYNLRNCSDVQLEFEWSVILYAESSDGVHFTKPPLGIVPTFRGSAATNAVGLRNKSTGLFDICQTCGTVFLDPQGDGDARYRSCATNKQGGGTSCQRSSDGLHWESTGTFMLGYADTQVSSSLGPRAIVGLT